MQLRGHCCAHTMDIAKYPGKQLLWTWCERNTGERSKCSAHLYSILLQVSKQMVKHTWHHGTSWHICLFSIFSLEILHVNICKTLILLSKAQLRHPPPATEGLRSDRRFSESWDTWGCAARCTLSYDGIANFSIGHGVTRSTNELMNLLNLRIATCHGPTPNIHQ